jgi:hypothetical protein
MKRALVSSLALFCFAAIAAIVVQSSRASPSVRSATFNFDIPTTFTEDKYVQMAEARPGTRRIEMMMGFLEYSVEPVKEAQASNVEIAKRFAGTWKGKPRHDAITDAVIIFKMEGAQLKGTIRSTSIRREEGGEPEIVRDEYVPLPELNVEGTTLTWKDKWVQPGHEVLRRVTLISDDEILFETVGTGRSSAQPTLLFPVSYKLKRERNPQ